MFLLLDLSVKFKQPINSIRQQKTKGLSMTINKTFSKIIAFCLLFSVFGVPGALAMEPERKKVKIASVKKMKLDEVPTEMIDTIVQLLLGTNDKTNPILTYVPRKLCRLQLVSKKMYTYFSIGKYNFLLFTGLIEFCKKHNIETIHHNVMYWFLRAFKGKSPYIEEMLNIYGQKELSFFHGSKKNEQFSANYARHLNIYLRRYSFDTRNHSLEKALSLQGSFARIDPKNMVTINLLRGCNSKENDCEYYKLNKQAVTELKTTLSTFIKKKFPKVATLMTKLKKDLEDSLNPESGGSKITIAITNEDENKFINALTNTYYNTKSLVCNFLYIQYAYSLIKGIIKIEKFKDIETSLKEWFKKATPKDYLSRNFYINHRVTALWDLTIEDTLLTDSARSPCSRRGNLPLNFIIASKLGDIEKVKKLIPLLPSHPKKKENRICGEYKCHIFNAAIAMAMIHNQIEMLNYLTEEWKRISNNTVLMLHTLNYLSTKSLIKIINSNTTPFEIKNNILNSLRRYDGYVNLRIKPCYSI
jgi:hypothetical protein